MSQKSNKRLNKAAKKKATSKKNTSQHVIPLGNGWVVKSAGNSRFTAITDSKKDAVAIARQIAKTKGSDLVIHTKDGVIQERISYAV